LAERFAHITFNRPGDFRLIQKITAGGNFFDGGKCSELRSVKGRAVQEPENGDRHGNQQHGKQDRKKAHLLFMQ
jgi:hypothetical protein